MSDKHLVLMNTATLPITKKLTIDPIAGHLEALEETIIFNLLARIQYKLNAEVYTNGRSGFENWNGSLLEKGLCEHEYMDSAWGRFTCPEERPFTNNLQPVQRTLTKQDTGIIISDFNLVNLTKEVASAHDELVILACERGDDGNYGSTVEHDIQLLRAISKRVHYGSFFVAEAKFQENPESFLELLSNEDYRGIETLLTREEIEKKILARVTKKTDEFQKSANVNYRNKVEPELMRSFYKSKIIPLTKKGEVIYICNRTL